MDDYRPLQWQIQYRDDRIAELVAEILQLREFKENHQKEVSHESCYQRVSSLRAELETAEKETDRALDKIEHMQRNLAFVHPDYVSSQARGDKLLSEKAKIRHEYSVVLRELRQEKVRRNEVEHCLSEALRSLQTKYERLHIRHTKYVEATTGIPAIPCAYENYIVIDSTLPDYETPTWILSAFNWIAWIVFVLGQIFAWIGLCLCKITASILSSLSQPLALVLQPYLSNPAQFISPVPIKRLNLACCDTVALIIAGTVVAIGNIIDAASSNPSEPLRLPTHAKSKFVAIVVLLAMLIWTTTQYAPVTIIKWNLIHGIKNSLSFLGCLYESASPKLTASSVPWTTYIARLVNLLTEIISRFKGVVELFVSRINNHQNLKQTFPFNLYNQGIAWESTILRAVREHGLAVYKFGITWLEELLHSFFQLVSKISDIINQYALLFNR